MIVYVYLDVPNKRLFVSTQRIVDPNTIEMMRSESFNQMNAMQVCKAYCLGLIRGQAIQYGFINHEREFL